MRFDSLNKCSEAPISSGIRQQKLIEFGENLIEIPIPSVFELARKEILHPFFVFQIFSCILWFFQDYALYSGSIVFTTLLALCYGLYTTVSNLRRLRDLARKKNTVTIINEEGVHQVIESSLLVPGDIVVLSETFNSTEKSSQELTFDIVLLSGECLTDESMLTGEANPVLKNRLPYHERPNEIYSPEEHSKYTLFCGTKILQINVIGNKAVIGVVVRTGFSTCKGKLFQSILFPRPLKFKFYSDSYKFFCGMACFGVLALGFQVYESVQNDEATGQAISDALGILTFAVPPALPLVLTVGVEFAVGRLKKKQIYCISPQRINFAGKIDAFVFDKTGTLTEETLGLVGIIPRSGLVFAKQCQRPADLAANSLPLLSALSCCHTLTLLHNDVIGPPLDRKMFEFTTMGFMDVPYPLEGSAIHPLATITNKQSFSGFQETKEGDHQALSITNNVFSHFQQFSPGDATFSILRRFEFQPRLQRMGVIAYSFIDKKLWFFAKGSPEKIQSICSPETVPSNYTHVFTQYASEGNYVLACAGKPLDIPLDATVETISREDLETSLHMNGLLIFKNQLRSDSRKVIQNLKLANIHCLMATGDNALTGISISKECGFVPEDSTILMAELHEGRFRWWNTTEGDVFRGDPLHSDQDDYKKDAHFPNENYSLVITGPALASLSPEDQAKAIDKGVIFARVAPEQKTQIVERLIDTGFTTGMCGDGTNDCGALKAAHVGCSLSEAEASIVAPFTSKVQSVACTEELVRQGRGALVGSFVAFKFMALYALLELLYVLRLTYNESDFGDWQYIYIDMILILPLATFMTFTTPREKLGKISPTHNLFGASVLVSLFGQLFIQLLVLAVGTVLLNRQPWFSPHIPNGDGWDPLTQEGTVTFLLCINMFVCLVVALSTDAPFRKPFFTNLFLGVSLIILGSWNMFLLFFAHYSSWIFNQFDLVAIPTDFKVTILIIFICDMLVSVLFEKVFVERLLGVIFLWCSCGPKKRNANLLEDSSASSSKQEENEYRTL